MDNRIIKAVVGALFGVLLLAINVEGMLSVIMLIVGIATVGINIMRIMAIKDLSGAGSRTIMIASIIGIILGVLLAVMRNSVLTVIIGIYMIVLPIIDVIMSKYKTEQLKAGLPRMLFGIVLVAIGPGKALEIVADIAGIVLIVLAVVYAVKLFLKDENRK